MNPSQEFVYITRSTEGETINGKPRPYARCYIVGPLFNEGVYSSTRHRDDASVFEREAAERLIAKTYWREARIENA